MTTIAEGVATHVSETLVDKAIQELKYLCCYKSYVEDFEEEKENLSARRNTVLKDINEANERNENLVDNEVELWLDRAKGLIEEDIEGKKKWFGLVTNCFWQYKRGKELEGKTQRIKQLLEQSNFTRVARSTGPPGIEFYSSPNFMQLKDRKLKFEKLKEALRDDKKFTVGLYGMGGTGKTTMAIEVGKQVAESKVFDKVIFSVVSKDANLKKIQDNVAKQLNFPLKEGTDESERAQQLWKRIAEGGEKVLIILDDLWGKLTLGGIGIPLGCQKNGCCSILLTTRDSRACIDMGCHEIIELEVLNEKDAVDLFLSYAGMSIDDGSSNGFKDEALAIVKECGRLPVAIVAVAKALKSRPLEEWKQALERLQNPEPIYGVNGDLKEAYNSLRLSYDNLKNEKAQKLFLLCSLFPEDYEIPIELLSRIAIGLGLCGEANRYSVARSRFTPIKNELINSCLILKAGTKSIKMHDLVREVALWIGNKQVQVGVDLNTTVLENVQYSSWNIIDFLNHFDGRKLEALLLWVNNINSYTMDVPDAIFEGMENLRILTLMSWLQYTISAASLFQSHMSFTNVRTLAIKELELGDVSMLVNLKSLESLELRKCSIFELPNEIRELRKLRLLEMVECLIQKSNPFEVIGSCLQLEELYYVSNDTEEQGHETESQITTLPKLQRYHIKGLHGIRDYEGDFSISRYFDSQRSLRVNFSDEVFKSLVARVEVLMLEENYYNRGWTNIVPDILSVENDSMEDHLTRLSLESMDNINCIINTKHLRSDQAIFSRLVELQLYHMSVRELCCGPYPVGFFKQLKKLTLFGCEKLDSTLFYGKLELCNLKSIYLFRCSMACLFHPSTAQSLKQLEVLTVIDCLVLKYIVADTIDDYDHNQKCHDSMFPKLKHLTVQSCSDLEFILPICFCEDLPLLESMEIISCGKVKYIFGQYPDEKDLHQIGKEAILLLLEEVVIFDVPNFINMYAKCYLPRHCFNDEVHKSSPSRKVKDGNNSLLMGHLCCFWPKSNASTGNHSCASMTTQLNHDQALMVNDVVNRTHGLFTLPLYPFRSLKKMDIWGVSGINSLFTLSISSSFKLLEILEVRCCNSLEHIVTDEGHDHDHMNMNSIFPKLQEVYVSQCSYLECMFPAFYSIDLKELKHVSISMAEQLTHVFGKCHADHNRNVQVDLNLPALKQLLLDDMPNMVSISAENYSLKLLYLEHIVLKGCSRLPLETLIDLLVIGHTRQEDISKKRAVSLERKGEPHSNLQKLSEFKDICVEPKKDMTFQNLSMLEIRGMKQMKFIFTTLTSRRLQKLRKLEVSYCEELVSIIEDDEENRKSPIAPHQICFPELRGIIVKHCKNMKCLFSLSCFGKLPQLLYVNIEDASQLGQVFQLKQVMDDVFPKLVAIRLVKLPALQTICQAIDFHTVNIRHVHKCGPAISLTSSNLSYVELLEFTRNIEDNNYYADILNWANEHEESSDDENEEACEELIKEDSKNEEASDEELIKEDSMNEESSKEVIEEDSMNEESSDEVIKEDSKNEESFEENEESSEEVIKEDSKNEEASEEVMKEDSKDEESSKENEDSSKEVIKEDSMNEESPKEVIEEDSVNEKSSQEGIEEDSVNEEALEELTNKEDSTSTNASANEIVEEKSSTTPVSNLSMELCGKEPMGDKALGESRSSNEAPLRVEEPTSQCSSKKTSNETIFPPFITGMTCPQGQIMVNQREDPIIEDDLIRLFQIMRDGSDLKLGQPHISKISAFDDDKVAKAFGDIESSLKMDLQQTANSEEHTRRLENALNFLCTYFSEEEPSSNGLVRGKIESLHKEIQRILSSFKQASDSLDTFTKLKEKEKQMDEQHSKKMDAAITLVSEISDTENYMNKLKEQICRLQAELKSKEKEFEDCEIKLSCLQKKKKECVLETIRFMEEYEAVKKNKSSVEDGQTKARQEELKKLENQWLTCMAELRKNALLLGILLKQKP